MSEKKYAEGMKDMFAISHTNFDANSVLSPISQIVQKYAIFKIIKSLIVRAVRKYFPNRILSVILCTV